MILLAGLGNPGDKYARTRHNAGFMFLDYIAHKQATETQQQAAFKFDKYTQCEITKTELTTHGSTPIAILLAKPQTFMNRSGEAVIKLLERWAMKHEPTAQSPQLNTLFVAHDDLDLELGNFKIQKGTGPKMHNGIASIEQALGTADFYRIRLGVDNRKGDRSMSGEAYVLQDFTDQEITLIQNTFTSLFATFQNILNKNTW